MAKDTKGGAKQPAEPQKAREIWELFALDSKGECVQALGTAESLEQAKFAITGKWASQFDPTDSAAAGTWIEADNLPKGREGYIYCWTSGTPAFLVERNGDQDKYF